MNDQDEAARSAGEGARETERARKAGPPRREECWALEEGGLRVLEGLRGRVGVRVRERKECKCSAISIC